MLGAIAGDVIGSVHEYAGTKTTEFDLFVDRSRCTDDTVLTVAVADCLLHGRDYVDAFHDYVRAYPDADYGARFRQWATSGTRVPYNSWGNGSAMRVAPVGHAFNSLAAVLDHAARSAAVTHNHPEGIKGAQATAAAVFLARTGETKRSIKESLERMFDYDLSIRLDELRPTYQFDESCQRTVPPAIVAFLESNDFEDAVRKAISLGGDADTLACIAGAIAEAYYGGVPGSIAARTLSLLDDRLHRIVVAFTGRYGVRLSTERPVR
jgi:ADP-ribosylglycohydrolase